MGQWLLCIPPAVTVNNATFHLQERMNAIYNILFSDWKEGGTEICFIEPFIGQRNYTHHILQWSLTWKGEQLYAAHAIVFRLKREWYQFSLFNHLEGSGSYAYHLL
jgi:hypothetical protein